MRKNELWQEYDHSGERLDSGRSPEVGNPKPDQPVFVSSASVWLYRRTENGIEVLFQHRSKSCSGYPDTWDRSCGGHVNLGERNLDAALREMKEEIGAEVPPEKIYFVSTHVSNFSNMIAHVYACDYTGMPDNFHFDDNEVSEVKWVSLDEFDNFMTKNGKVPLQDDVEVHALFKKWLKARGNN